MSMRIVAADGVPMVPNKGISVSLDSSPEQAGHGGGAHNQEPVGL
jgi:hypothetical protein